MSGRCVGLHAGQVDRQELTNVFGSEISRADRQHG
jgi:hypothetical protein